MMVQLGTFYNKIMYHLQIIHYYVVFPPGRYVNVAQKWLVFSCSCLSYL
jgi:hypothetical protein